MGRFDSLNSLCCFIHLIHTVCYIVHSIVWPCKRQQLSTSTYCACENHFTLISVDFDGRMFKEAKSQPTDTFKCFYILELQRFFVVVFLSFQTTNKTKIKFKWFFALFLSSSCAKHSVVNLGFCRKSTVWNKQ